MKNKVFHVTAANIYWAESWLVLWRGLEATMIRNLVGSTISGRVLDIGCGDGRFGYLMQQIINFPDGLIGIENDFNRLCKAQKLQCYQYVVNSSAYKLPFQSSTFTTVILNSTIEHLEQPQIALEECARILEPGGLLVLTAPSIQFENLLLIFRILQYFGFQSLAARYARWKSRGARHHYYWDDNQWDAELAGCGFEVASIVHFATPTMMVASDVGHLIRAFGLGGSRFSLLSSEQRASRPLLDFTARQFEKIERTLLQRELARPVLERYGALAIIAMRIC